MQYLSLGRVELPVETQWKTIHQLLSPPVTDHLKNLRAERDRQTEGRNIHLFQPYAYTISLSYGNIGLASSCMTH